MTDRTLGPWSRHQDEGPWSRHQDGETVDILAKNHGLVTTVSCGGPNPDRNAKQRDYARLIAAAPKLLAALENLRTETVEALEAFNKTFGRGVTTAPVVSVPAIKQADAAIAAAKGQ